MNEILDYIKTNKEWIFSGIGVLIVALIIELVVYKFWKKNKPKNIQNKAGDTIETHGENSFVKMDIKLNEFSEEDLAPILKLLSYLYHNTYNDITIIEIKDAIQTSTLKTNYFLEELLKYSYIQCKSVSHMPKTLTYKISEKGKKLLRDRDLI